MIKKVAEAKARKKKRAMNKLKAAKKAATLMAENSELTEKQKLKAIAKATNKFKGDKPSKVYITTRKTKAGSVATAGGKIPKVNDNHLCSFIYYLLMQIIIFDQSFYREVK